jgi:glucokinase
VISAFSGGDEAARRILEESAAYLGRSIVDFLYAYDPEAVVLGGGVASSEAFVDLVREAVDREPMMPAFRGVPVLQASLGTRSVICGTRHLAGKLVKDTA